MRLEPLLVALNSQGPAVVAVDSAKWFNYWSGVFDDCDRDATLGHAVLLQGYGITQEGQPYWLVQNSWGSTWGERGFIRLARQADEEHHCGTDFKPEQGVACDGGPESITVCGTCGILYDAIVPEGVRLVQAHHQNEVTTSNILRAAAAVRLEPSAPTHAELRFLSLLRRHT